jgi:cytochrome c
MGLRHPFRITVDSRTGRLYWAEPGPNAAADDSLQGPRGYEVVSTAKGPGNYGWPYCRANPTTIQKPATVATPYFCYRAYNYSGSGAAGPMFNPNALRNVSKNNTGIVNLPPMKPATVWYPYNSTGTAFPVFGNGCTANCNAGMLGPVYHYDGSPGAPPGRLPIPFDNHIFIVEWQRNLLFVAPLDSAGGIGTIRAFRNTTGTRDSVVNGPIDVKIGPDGALYFLNWVGNSYPTNFGNGTLVRYAYTGTQVPVFDASRHGAGTLRGGLVLAGPGDVVALPEGVRGVVLYSLRGQELWRGRPAEAGARAIALPASLSQGLFRLRFLGP